MMNFNLTNEQKELQARAQFFARKMIAPHIAEMDRTNNYPWPVIKELSEEGFMGITIPMEYGGQGRPLIDAIIVVEEIAKVCGTIARVVVDSNTAVPKAIAEYGTEEQKKNFLPTIVGGDKPVIAITEPEAGSAATWLKTSATIEDQHVVLNGKKCWITGAGSSRLYLVFARFNNVVGADGIGGVLVTSETEGLNVTRIPMMMGLRGMPEGEVDLVNCRVPKSNILVMPGDGFRKLMRSYNLQRVGAAAVALGIGQGAFDLAAIYANKRKQFGESIANFQGIKWMFADMHMRLESARMLVYCAAMSGASGFPDKMAAATAKVCASEAAIAVTNTALQIHGAAGYSCDLPLERMVRDARMFTIGGGTAEMQRNLIGTEILASASTQLREVA